MSLSTIVPNTWKTARVIPLLKPGKPDEVAKIIEKWYYHQSLTIYNYHSFRRCHSTTTALHMIHDQIYNGLNKKRPNHRTVMVTLGLSQVNATKFKSTPMKVTSRNQTTKLCSYIRGRYTSSVRQGSPISPTPTLFNMYAKYANTTWKHFSDIIYAIMTALFLLVS